VISSNDLCSSYSKKIYNINDERVRKKRRYRYLEKLILVVD